MLLQPRLFRWVFFAMFLDELRQRGAADQRAEGTTCDTLGPLNDGAQQSNVKQNRRRRLTL